jgi:hypothetical protein
VVEWAAQHQEELIADRELAEKHGDLKPPVDKGGVFTALRDIEAFKAFSIDPEWHVLSWEDGRINVAPETVYEEATGEEVLPLVADRRTSYGADS